MSDRRRLVRKAENVPALASSPVNLITNPSAEVDLTGWSVSGGTAALSRDNSATTGSWSFKMAGSVTSNDASLFSPPFAIAAGEALSARCDINVQDAFNSTNAGRIIVQWDNGGSTFALGTATGSNVSAGVGAKVASIANAVAPATTTQARLRIVGDTTGADTFDWRVDSVIAVKSATVPTYFDGDTPGYGWYGVPHASMSAPLVTVIRDLENGSTYQSVRGSWVITPGPRKPTWANSQRRYGGARQTGETHDNGTIGWTIMAKGATLDDSLVVVEALLGDLEAMVARTADVFVEWRPDGAADSTYCEVRGPASWQANYEWARFVGTGAIPIDVKIPVAPIADLDSYRIIFALTTMPAVVALTSSITGTAPARADISLTASGGSAAPIWALLGWTKSPGSPLASSVAPHGVIQAETGASLSTWAVTADGNYRGGSGLKATTSGAGSASASFAVDPSVMQPDEFSSGEIAVTVWGRFELAATVVSPRVFVSLRPFAGTSFGAEQFGSEFGSAGKLLTLPSSGTRFRFVKLGTLNLPVDTTQPLKHNIVAAASWAAGSSGQFGFDYTVLVPSRQCALSPSSKPNDATFPKFIASTGATTKTIRHDLSGRVASGPGNPGRDSGLGGSVIWLPPGNVDLLVKLSSLVADDPTVDTSNELGAHDVSGSVRITPRVFLAG